MQNVARGFNVLGILEKVYQMWMEDHNGASELTTRFSNLASQW